jgi:hypothetical protein
MYELTNDFWAEAEQSDVCAIVCTINTVCKKDGTLVMGAGIAKDFAERIEWLPERWGVRTARMSNGPTYPFVEIMQGNHPDIVGIHTKLDWRDPSPLNLVDRSIKQLYIVSMALEWRWGAQKRILMTRPGCGHGGLSWSKQIKPLMDKILDDRFVVINQQ